MYELQVNLEPKQYIFLMHRFGFYGEKPKTRREMADIFNMTEAEARAFELDTLKVLRKRSYLMRDIAESEGFNWESNSQQEEADRQRAEEARWKKTYSMASNTKPRRTRKQKTVAVAI
jgi:hypothetical protein